MKYMDQRAWAKMACVGVSAFLAALVANATNSEGPIADVVRLWAPVIGALGATATALYGFLDKTVANAETRNGK